MLDELFISDLLAPCSLPPAHNRDEQIGDAGCAHFAKRGELATIDMIEQHDATTEHLPLVQRLERPRAGDVVRMHHHFRIARFEFLHAAFEHDATVIDEHEIGQDILDLFHLMRRYYDRASAI